LVRGSVYYTTYQALAAVGSGITTGLERGSSSDPATVKVSLAGS
jgi:hypothetical protein